MSDSKPVSLPPHLWEALDLMAAEMGVGRDALLSQAVFTLARLNGYVVAGRGVQAAASPPSVAAKPAPAVSKPPPKAVAPAPKRPIPEPEPEPEPEPAEEDDGNPFDEPEAAEDDYQEEPVEEAPPEDELPPEEEEEPAPPPRAAAVGKQVLSIIMAGRDPYKMTGDTVTIGRGKSCEFVIESNRVSREHARVLKEGPGFVLEDLNSSNGTFFGPQKEKVTRRPIRDGDEFTFGTEKVKFQIRK